MPTLAEVQVEGILLEDIDDDISALTIDLKNTITADALATLLRGLATFYKVGVRLDGPDYDPFVTFKSASGGINAESSDELLIAQLVIGTPNKVRLEGRSRWLRDLRKLLLALALFLPAGEAHDVPNATPVTAAATSTVNLSTTAPAHGDAAEFGDQFYKNIEAQRELDAQMQDGRITLSEYVELRAALESARKDLIVAMSIARTRVK
jgi:hypothetical protein